MTIARRSRSTTSTVSKETSNVTASSPFSIASLISQVRLGIVCLVLAAAALMLPAAAAAAGPELTLGITHEPETFHRGEAFDLYALTVTNTGDAPTTGPITITDALPAGLTGGFLPTSLLIANHPSGGSQFTCTGDGSPVLPGAKVLACTRTAALAPGESAPVSLRVAVGVEAPDLVTNEVTVSGGGAPATVSAADPTPVADNPFTIKLFAAQITTEAEVADTTAGDHPFQNVTQFNFPLRDFALQRLWAENQNGEIPEAVEDPKDAFVTLPPGFIGNPAAAARCPLSQIGDPNNLNGGGRPTHCPPGSQIGISRLAIVGTDREYPIYNLVPESGYPAQFGFVAGEVPTILSVVPLSRSESYGLTVGTPTIPSSINFRAFKATFYGLPGQRPITGPEDGSGGTDAPFLSNSVDCSDSNPSWKLTADSWEHPGRYHLGGYPLADLSDPEWKTASVPAAPVTGCDNPTLASQFGAATVATRPLQPGGGPVQADQPSGLAVDLDFPQPNDPTNPNTTYEPETPQTPEPKEITVKLPPGLSISPSSADGLQACSDLASGPAGDQVHYDNTKPVTCPDSSKIGSAVATSPLIALRDPVTDAVIGPEPIPGDVYLLKPHPGDLPFGGGNQAGKFRLLIQLENPKIGVNIKLPGVATADPVTGQLTATFIENPQLPASHIAVNLKEGPRAPLATPVTCGTFTTTTDLVPWSTPGTPDAHPTANFAVGSGPGGSGCPSSAAGRPFAPSLSAGTESSRAGAASPFVLKLTRNDGEGELGSLETTMPPGFSAKLAGVPYCPDSAIAAASGRSGVAEQGSSSCPAASQIGTVTAGAGPGTNPYYVQGKAYLAGPYKGAPLSAVFVTPAVAGPFDLGDVVVRAALEVNPETVQVTVKTDPLPRILDGVPLRLRSITARIDRSDFTLNPTNCEPMAIKATVGSSDGATASPSNSFQVGGCKSLSFKPQLKLSLKGATKRIGHPALKAILTAKPGEAGIARAQVNLPHSEFLDQGNLNKTCTKPVLLAGNCPATSIYGKATAWTPLLEKPLEGPVYLVGGYGYKLPALVAELNGQIRVVLVGKVDSGKNKGIRNTFEVVPDAPVSRFVLEMKGGKKYGLLENSEDLCKRSQVAIASFTGQNGMVENLKPKIANSCGKKKKHRHKGKKGKGKGAKHGKGTGGHKRIAAWLTSVGF